VEKAEIAGGRHAPGPIGKSNLEQDVDTDQVGVDELSGTIDRSVHMTFGR
jgi:hypothetical protein